MTSILDLLPEEPIPIPHTKGRIAEKGFNLVEDVCAWCGKTYTRRTGTIVYEVQLDKKRVKVCSWTCKAEALKKKPTPKRGGCTLTAQERIDKKMRQLCEDRLLLDSEAARSMTKKELERVKERMRRHVKEIHALEEELENAGVGGV